MERRVLKGIRWILLKNPQNLRPDADPRKDERKRLQDALEINQPLMVAYYLKEDLRQFWDQPDKDSADRFLDHWLGRAESSGILVLPKIARRLRGFRLPL